MDCVPSLGAFIIPILTTAQLIFILNNWPGIRDTRLILEQLCTRDLRAAFGYLLSLPFSHSHRPVLLDCLTPRLRWLKLEDLQDLANLFPRLSALVERDDGVLVPKIGPLSDLETGLWTSCDWYFGLLHSRKMAGTIPVSIYRYQRCVSLDQFINVRLHFL